TQRTPLLTTRKGDESGKKWDVKQESGLRFEKKVKNVEFFRDVKPIFERSCGRRGADIRTHVHAQAIEPGKVHLSDQTIEADTIVLAAGIVPNPIVAGLPVEKDRHGHIVVDGTMRSPSRPEVWALGDCATIPAPDGTPYPNLAQHALREAKVLAKNIRAVLDGQPPQPFV